MKSKHSKIICLAETWIYPNEMIDLPNRSNIFSSYGNGKGCGVYYNDGLDCKKIEKYVSEEFQLVSFIHEEVQIILLYISKGANLKAVVKKLKTLCTFGPKVVIGDVNFDFTSVNVLSNFLFSLGLTQIVNQPTHIDGNMIDHCYVSDVLKDNTQIEYNFPYYTDHVALCLSFNK